SGACSAPTTPWRRTRSTRARSTGWASRPTRARACRRSSRSARRASRSARARTCPSSTPGGRSGRSSERLPHRAVRDAGLQELGPLGAVAQALVEGEHRQLRVQHQLASAALGCEPGARVETEAALVGGVAGQADLVQAEAVEGVPAEERDRVAAEALAPLLLPPDHDAERRVAVDGVDLVEPAV